MSDLETSGTPKGDKVGAWNDAAMYNLLLHIVAQLQEGGKSIKWDRIKIPGRTTKSLQNQWTKIRKQIAELDLGNEDGNAHETPTKTPRKATPRKTQAKKGVNVKEDDELSSIKHEASDYDDDDNAETEPGFKANTPKKRASAGEAKNTPKGKKAKVEPLEDPDTEI